MKPLCYRYLVSHHDFEAVIFKVEFKNGEFSCLHEIVALEYLHQT